MDQEITTIKNIYDDKVTDFKPLNIPNDIDMDSEVLNYLQEFGIVHKPNLTREKKSTSNNNEELLIKIIKNLEELTSLNISINDTKTMQNEYSTENTLTTSVFKRQADEDKEKQVSALEDSFGAGDINKNNQNELPPKKKNGFYLLADWNSFLEVGEGDQKVVVRLNKTIGDPSVFIPVKIP